MREGKIIDVANQLLRYQDDENKINRCLSSATSISVEGSISFSTVVNENEHEWVSDSQALKCYTFCQPNNSHGAYPPPLIAKTNKTLWFLQLAACISPRLCQSFVESKVYISLKPVLAFLCKVFIPFKSKKFREVNITKLLILAQDKIRKIIDVSRGNKVTPNSGTSFYEAGDFLEKVCTDVIHLKLKKRSELCSYLLQILTRK